MEGILKFDLPQEDRSFQLAIDAPKYSCALYEMQRQIRRLRKGDVESVTIEELQDAFYSVLNDHEIFLD